MVINNLSIEQILMIVMGVNTLLTGLSKILEFYKDKTESKVDDQVYYVIHKILKLLSVLIEFLSANSKK